LWNDLKGKVKLPKGRDNMTPPSMGERKKGKPPQKRPPEEGKVRVLGRRVPPFSWRKKEKRRSVILHKKKSALWRRERIRTETGKGNFGRL